MSRRLSWKAGNPVAPCDQSWSALIELAHVTGVSTLGEQGAVVRDLVHIDGGLVPVWFGGTFWRGSDYLSLLLPCRFCCAISEEVHLTFPCWWWCYARSFTYLVELCSLLKCLTLPSRDLCSGGFCTGLLCVWYCD